MARKGSLGYLLKDCLHSFPNKEGGKIMRRSKIKLVGLAMIVGLVMPGLIATNVLAQRVIVKEVAVKRIRVVEEVVKVADNFIVLFDA